MNLLVYLYFALAKFLSILLKLLFILKTECNKLKKDFECLQLHEKKEVYIS